MKRLLIVNNRQRGAALGFVLVFMVTILLLGSAVLFATYSNVVQTVAVVNADRPYYAAESAVQLVAQLILAEYNCADFPKIRQAQSGYASVVESQFRDYLYYRLNGVFNAHAIFVPGPAPGYFSVVLHGIDVTLALPEWDIAIETYQFTLTHYEMTPPVIETFTNAWISDFNFNITATAGRRTVQAQTGQTTHTTVNTVITPGQPGTPGTPGTPGGGIWLGGGNLINTRPGGWGTVTGNRGVHISQGEGVPPVLVNPDDPPWRNDINSMFNVNDTPSAYRGHIDLSNYGDTVRSAVNAINLEITNNPPPGSGGVLTFGWGNSPPNPLTPAHVAGYHTVISNGPPLYFEGASFPDLRSISATTDSGIVSLAGTFPALQAVNAASVNLGNDNRAFISDRSATPSEPLFIYARRGQDSNINYRHGGVTLNTIIHVYPGSFVITGNSVRGADGRYPVIRNNAQVYANRVSTHGATVSLPGWNPQYVPTFVSDEDMNVLINAANGFSGIFYATRSNFNVTITAPSHNGMFAAQDGRFVTLNNVPGNFNPVYLYFRLDEATHANIHPNLQHYFQALINNSPENSGLSGGPIAPTEGTPPRDDTVIITVTPGASVFTNLDIREI